MEEVYGGVITAAGEQQTGIPAGTAVGFTVETIQSSVVVIRRQHEEKTLDFFYGNTADVYRVADRARVAGSVSFGVESDLYAINVRRAKAKVG